MRLILAISMILGFVSCTTKLLNPLDNGTRYKKPDNLLGAGAGIYLIPHGSSVVKSGERCEIVMVVRVDDSSYIILAHGKYEITYGNLKTSHVSKGQKLARGQIVGEVYDSTDVLSTLLEGSVRKQNRVVTPNW